LADPVPPSAADVSQNTPDTIAPQHASGENTLKYLDAAYLALAAKQYTMASIEMEKASISCPPSLRPETIYLTGLLYADPENPSGDMNKAYETLQKIEEEHPDSNRAGEVRILTDLLYRMQSMQAENKDLLQEIIRLRKKLTAEQNSVQRLKGLMKKMKEIDLGLMPEE
jgi:hypothetical protein